MFIKTVLKSLEHHLRFAMAINDYLITSKNVIIRVADTIALEQADDN